MVLKTVADINKAIQQALKKSKLAKTALGKKFAKKDIKAVFMIGNMVQIENANLGTFICSIGDLKGELETYAHHQEPIYRWWRYAQMHPKNWNEAAMFLQGAIARCADSDELETVLAQIEETDLREDEDLAAVIDEGIRLAKRNNL